MKNCILRRFCEWYCLCIKTDENVYIPKENKTNKQLTLELLLSAIFNKQKLPLFAQMTNKNKCTQLFAIFTVESNTYCKWIKFKYCSYTVKVNQLFWGILIYSINLIRMGAALLSWPVIGVKIKRGYSMYFGNFHANKPKCSHINGQLSPRPSKIIKISTTPFYFHA